MHRRNFSSRGGHSARRKSDWVKSADQGFVAVAAGASVMNQSFIPADGETVVRTRGIIAVKVNSTVADANVVGAIGFAVVSEQAAAAGAASIPGPYSNADWDGWFVHEFWSHRFEFIDGTGFGLITQIIDLDSKAMRKLSAGDRVVVMTESQAVAADVSVQFRMLLKLP